VGVYAAIFIVFRSATWLLFDLAAICFAPQLDSVAADYPFMVVRLVVTSIAGSYYFVLAGARTAPKHRFVTAIVLAICCLCGSALLLFDLWFSYNFGMWGGIWTSEVSWIYIPWTCGCGAAIVACVMVRWRESLIWIVNLDDLSFQEWVRFIFDHPVSDPAWFWEDDEYDIEYECTPEVSLRLYTRLFTNPAFLLDEYSPEQIQQGFDFIYFGSGQTIDAALWDEKTDFGLRQQCICSMVALYENLFTRDPISDTSVMWWDRLRDWGIKPCSDDDRVAVQDVMFKALTRILGINSVNCWEGALHGLGHLRHKDTRIVIDEWLKSGVCKDKELREYAETCKTGDIM
jgi:hypothetical protein